ncbi:hypothetical protein YB2330_000994 [Saitoella coloradoensis]
MSDISAVLVVIITIFLPPLGVFLISGCSADFLINICLTVLGYLPGHIHAFYLEYKHYKRLEEERAGYMPAPGDRPAAVYSDSTVQPGAGNGRDVRRYGSTEQTTGVVGQQPPVYKK